MGCGSSKGKGALVVVPPPRPVEVNVNRNNNVFVGEIHVELPSSSSAQCPSEITQQQIINTSVYISIIESPRRPGDDRAYNKDDSPAREKNGVSFQEGIESPSRPPTAETLADPPIQDRCEPEALNEVDDRQGDTAAVGVDIEVVVEEVCVPDEPCWNPGDLEYAIGAGRVVCPDTPGMLASTSTLYEIDRGVHSSDMSLDSQNLAASNDILRFERELFGDESEAGSVPPPVEDGSNSVCVDMLSEGDVDVPQSSEWSGSGHRVPAAAGDLSAKKMETCSPDSAKDADADADRLNRAASYFPIDNDLLLAPQSDPIEDMLKPFVDKNKDEVSGSSAVDALAALEADDDEAEADDNTETPCTGSASTSSGRRGRRYKGRSNSFSGLVDDDGDEDEAVKPALQGLRSLSKSSTMRRPSLAVDNDLISPSSFWHHQQVPVTPGTLDPPAESVGRGASEDGGPVDNLLLDLEAEAVLQLCDDADGGSDEGAPREGEGEEEGEAYDPSQPPPPPSYTGPLVKALRVRYFSIRAGIMQYYGSQANARAAVNPMCLPISLKFASVSAGADDLTIMVQYGSASPMKPVAQPGSDKLMKQLKSGTLLLKAESLDEQVAWCRHIQAHIDWKSEM